MYSAEQQPDSPQNSSHPLEPGYKREIPKGLPPRQNDDDEQSQGGILLIDGPYYRDKQGILRLDHRDSSDSDDKQHRTCCCIIH